MSDASSTPAALPAVLPKWLARRIRPAPVIPVVRLEGSLAAGKRPGRLNMETVGPLIARAFRYKKAPAIAFIVNSPGGSAVQSRLIMQMIRDRANESGQKVLVFVEDAAASGGYFIACAGDEIIADPSSIIGSIGVIFAGFGFEKAIEKLGVTRRVHTAGKSKSTMDPFLPEKKEDIARIKALEADIHLTFIDNVKARRGDRLKGADEDLFTGEFWTGRKALELGLVDALGEVRATLRARYGEHVQLKFVTAKRPLFALPGLGLSTEGLTEDVVTSLESRALWARLGL